MKRKGQDNSGSSFCILFGPVLAPQPMGVYFDDWWCWASNSVDGAIRKGLNNFIILWSLDFMGSIETSQSAMGRPRASLDMLAGS